MKVLYPRPKRQEQKHSAAPQENLANRPYHVEYSDPNDPNDQPEWGHYNSELAVKTDAWYRSKLLGFKPQAVLYTKDELKQLTADE